MSDETIVAIYDTPAHAQLAAADLREAGVPDSAITVHAGSIDADHAGAAPREQGFWASLFGGAPDHDTSVYDRSIGDGSSVLTVKAPDQHVARVMDILESHAPIDIDERAMSYTAMPQGDASSVAGNVPAALRPHETGDIADLLQLSDEAVPPGNRVVNRGGNRIRRYVAERSDE